MRTYTILYKSGTKIQIRASNLQVIRYANGALEIKWDKIDPKPFYLGVDNIEAIFEGRFLRNDIK